MKTLAILFLTLFTTFTSFASTVEPISTSLEGKAITVYFNYEKSETVSISIVDKVGYVLLSEKIETKNRKSRKYNLEQLPEGVYTIKIDSDQKIVYKEILTDNNESVVLSENVTFKPTTFFQDNRWNINLLSLGKNVDIKIFDADYEEVFEDKIKGESVIAKSYNLSELAYGVYTLSVIIDGSSYNKVIAKM